ncbi:MAG: recombinase zinc beta ribbon domain-containing protein [Bacteroidetes bacterium]|nr:recombinase zinc beta ribbon domain-containing protein [Bacteroidota bacterium]
MPNKISTYRDELPLRGHLICPKCGRTLTGSGSTGRSGDKFYYYHCLKGCKERINAIDTNAAFTQKLKSLRLNSQEINIFMKNLSKRLKDNSSNNNTERIKVATDIEKNKLRLKNAQMLMLDGDISSLEYHEMKLKFEREILDLSQEQNKFSPAPISHDKIIDTCKNVILNLDIAYEKADTQIKQRIIGSIFPEKFMFENNRVRTTKVNEVILKLCASIKDSRRNKKGQQTFFELLPCEVGPPGLEPGTKRL